MNGGPLPVKRAAVNAAQFASSSGNCSGELPAFSARAVAVTRRIENHGVVRSAPLQLPPHEFAYTGCGVRWPQPQPGPR